MSAAGLATQKAEAFLREHNIIELPIDPFAIAKDLGIMVQAKTASEGVSGMLIRHGDQFAIAYATHIASEGFQRFSVSHELGHYSLSGHPDSIFDSQGIHESRAGFVSDNKFEREADYFAAGLLMPAFLFKEEMKTAGEGLDAIEKLADKCKTSLPATAIRYTQLTDNPVAAIQSIGDKIEWCSMSDALREIRGLDWIKKGAPLPRNTTTYDFNKNETNIVMAQRTDSMSSLQEWFNGTVDIGIAEEVKGLGQYGSTLTILTIEELDIENLQEEEDLEESWTPQFKR